VRSGAGPDAFGYVVDDSTEPGGPTFSWVAATHVITDLHGEDDARATVALPFPVNFYGSTYNSVIVSTNGNAHMFDNSNLDYTPYCLPDPNYSTILGIIAPFWTDFDLGEGVGGDVYTDVIGTSPNRVFIIEWRDVSFYGDPDSLLTFETLIYENTSGPNEIRYQYSTLVGDGARGDFASVGIQSYDRTAGLSYSCGEPVLTENLAVRFRVPQRAAGRAGLSQQHAKRRGGGGHHRHLYRAHHQSNRCRQQL
jgi:hypothetical protein